MAFKIDAPKITRYLLTTDPAAEAEALGKSKFFHQIGYSAANWTLLEQALLQHPATSVLEATSLTPYGQKKIYRCTMPTAPNGRGYCVRSVWMQRGADFWLSTVYPQIPNL